MKMNRLLIYFLLLGMVNIALAEYPDDKPIKIIVHTKPGGAVDLMARQIAQIGGKYTPQSIVVINKAGGSGLLALANVYNSVADGYTILAFPAAFLAPIQTTNIGFGLDDFHYIACMTISPEAIITKKNGSNSTFEQLLKSAKATPGNQKWCGPGSGTLDHLMAVKVWDKAGMTAKWIPYGGGGPAIAAVMGGHADVYVGNPEDILGREENLQIAAIASEKRHPQFPETPTFSEMGIDLTHEVMWRGFAVKEGTDEKVIAYLEELFYKISQDKHWKEYIKRTRVQEVFLRNEAFSALVKKDAASSRVYLKKAGFKIGSVPEQAPWSVAVFIAILSFLIVLAWFIKPKNQKLAGSVFITLSGLAVGLLFYYQSLYFPAPLKTGSVGAASVPRVWILFLVISALFVVAPYLRGKIEEKLQVGNVRMVWVIVALITTYTVLMPVIGFFPATFFMLLAGMAVMRYKKVWMIVTVSSIVIIFMYFVFYKLLMVPLPMGILF